MAVSIRVLLLLWACLVQLTTSSSLHPFGPVLIESSEIYSEQMSFQPTISPDIWEPRSRVSIKFRIPESDRQAEYELDIDLYRICDGSIASRIHQGAVLRKWNEPTLQSHREYTIHFTLPSFVAQGEYQVVMKVHLLHQWPRSLIVEMDKKIRVQDNIASNRQSRTEISDTDSPFDRIHVSMLQKILNDLDWTNDVCSLCSVSKLMREKCDSIFRTPFPAELLEPKDSEPADNQQSPTASENQALKDPEPENQPSPTVPEYQPLTTKDICSYASIEVWLQKLEFKYTSLKTKTFPDYPTHQIRKRLKSSIPSSAMLNFASIWTEPTIRSGLYSNFNSRYKAIIEDKTPNLTPTSLPKLKTKTTADDEPHFDRITQSRMFSRLTKDNFGQLKTLLERHANTVFKCPAESSNLVETNGETRKPVTRDPNIFLRLVRPSLKWMMLHGIS